MRRMFSILILALIVISANAQYEHIVYLKNGSIVKGKIIELKTDDYLKFKSNDGSLWVFKVSDIDKYDFKKESDYDFERDTLKKRFLLCDLGFLVGTVANDMKAPLSFLTTYNFQLYNSLYFGIGTGLEFYQMTYIPLIADFRIAPDNSNVSFYLQGGPTFPMSKKGNIDQVDYKFKRGYFINPGISYTFSSKNQAKFIISIGYRYQRTDADRVQQINEPYYYSQYNNDYSIITKLNRFVIRFGYRFK